MLRAVTRSPKIWLFEQPSVIWCFQLRCYCEGEPLRQPSRGLMNSGWRPHQGGMSAFRQGRNVRRWRDLIRLTALGNASLSRRQVARRPLLLPWSTCIALTCASISVILDGAAKDCVGLSRAGACEDEQRGRWLCSSPERAQRPDFLRRLPCCGEECQSRRAIRQRHHRTAG